MGAPQPLARPEVQSEPMHRHHHEDVVPGRGIDDGLEHLSVAHWLTGVRLRLGIVVGGSGRALLLRH